MFKGILAAVLCGALLALPIGCTATQKGAVIGGVLGAGTGALIGDRQDKTAAGAVIGGAAGAAAGAAAGHYIGKKKYCPKCGKTFAKEADFCDVDGTALRWKGGEEASVEK